jgi:hypothetical protein
LGYESPNAAGLIAYILEQRIYAQRAGAPTLALCAQIGAALLARKNVAVSRAADALPILCACRSVQEDVYEKDNLQRCLTVFQDFDERLLEVLRDTDPSTVTEHGLYERPVDKMTDEVCHAC